MAESVACQNEPAFAACCEDPIHLQMFDQVSNSQLL